MMLEEQQNNSCQVGSLRLFYIWPLSIQAKLIQLIVQYRFNGQQAEKNYLLLYK